MTLPNENGRGESAAHTCINCGESVRPDGFAEGRAMFIDAAGNRTCETLGGGEETPAHFVNPEQMPQGDSALRDLVNRAMRLACASLGLAEEYSGGDSETLAYLARQYAELNIEVANTMHGRRFPVLES